MAAGASIGADYGATAPTNGLIVEGNVGIGTSSPATRLDVAHPATQMRFGPSAADNGGYLISTNPSQAIIAAGASWNGSNWIAKSNVASLTANQDGRVQFFTN